MHPDRRIEARLETSVPQIGAKQVWEQFGARGKGVTVAIVDSGIDYTHPALRAQFIGGHDFIGDDADPMDDHGHGTHVAGIVAGNAAPVIGVAPEASLLAYKVLDEHGYGEDSGMLAAIEKLLDPDANGDFSDRADVVNMSLGKSVVLGDDPVIDAIELAVQSGVVFAVAAGNEGAYFAVGSPGVAPSVITVGATDRNDVPAPFTSQGPVAHSWTIKPEVTAPGVDIVSAKLGGETIDFSGTSMATPHVAGVAALLRQLHPQWTAAEVKAAIVSTAKPLDSIITAGSGRVDAVAASQVTILPSPSTLSFGVAAGGTPPVQTLRLTNRGTTVQNVTLASFGMTIVPSNVTIPGGETVAVTMTLITGDTAPPPNDSGIALSGRVTIATSSGTSYVPWIYVTGDLVAATYSGGDPAIVVMARDGYVLAEGIRTAVTATHRGNIDIFVVTMPDHGGPPRIIVRENVVVTGGVQVVSVTPDEATHTLTFDGVDEHGVPLRDLGVMSRGGMWLRRFDLLLPSGVTLQFGSELTLQWDREQPVLLSPMATTRFRTFEGEERAEYIRPQGYVHVAHLGVHRELEGIHQNETLTFAPGDWVTQTFDNPCATDCTNYLFLSAGSQGAVFTHFGWTRTSGTVSLTRGGGDKQPWFSLAIDEADHPQLPFTKGRSLMSPSFHAGEDGRMRLRMFSGPSPVDYVPPHGEPATYGYGPTVLRSSMGMRWAAGAASDRDEWCISAQAVGPLGEDLADDSLRLQITMYDAGGVPNPGARLVTDNYVLTNALTPGKHRLEVIGQYRIGDGTGRGTMISHLDTLTNAAAPTLSSLRVVDAQGRSVTNVGANTDAALQFSARESVYTFGNVLAHHEIDSAATRVWWRAHGSSEWHPLTIGVTGIDYEGQDRAGPAGTIYRASLRHIATTQRGAVDLKFALKSPTGATTEWTMEPAFFVTPGRRRAVR